MRRIGVSRFCLALALLLSVSPFRATAFGQRGNSARTPVSRSIEGTVRDPSGHPVSGAVVLIEDLKSLQIRSYIVQQDGKFVFRGLSSDANYQLRARLNGVTSKAKTVSVFATSPAIVVTLTLSTKPKRPTGNPS